MVLTNKGGWLYFLGETDFKTDETYSYVKIGKTNYDRPVSKRKNDHQTGNPRHIVEVAKNIRTNFIDTLETYMHNRFATKRVHGEWFLLDKKELEKVVSEANRVNTLLDTVLTEAQAVKEISKSESNGNIFSATGSINVDYQEFLAYEKERVLHSLNKDNIKFKIIELTALHSGVRGISEQSIVSRNKFDEEEFGKAHQDIYSKYVKVKEQLSGNFTIIKKPTAANSYKDLNSELNAAKDKFKNIAKFRDKKVDRDSKFESLHQEWLELTENEAQAQLLSEIYSLKLKHACGLNESIENICKWKRVSKEKETLDKKSLEADEKELYNKFMVLQSDYPKCVIIRGHPY